MHSFKGSQLGDCSRFLSLFIVSSFESLTTPPLGAAAAWVDVVEAFGSGNVTLAEVLEPAIRLAEEGCVALFFLAIKLLNKAHKRPGF